MVLVWQEGSWLQLKSWLCVLSLGSPVAGCSAKWAPMWADSSSNPMSKNWVWLQKRNICMCCYVYSTHNQAVTYLKEIQGSSERCCSELTCFGTFYAHPHAKLPFCWSACYDNFCLLSQSQDKAVGMKKNYASLFKYEPFWNCTGKNITWIMERKTLLATKSQCFVTNGQSISLC